jgi:type IV secretory pathway component VirB8
MKKIFHRKKKDESPLSYYSCEITQLQKETDKLRQKLKGIQCVFSLLVLSFVVISGSQLWLLFSKDRDLIVLHDSGNGVSWVTQERVAVTPTEAATESNLANYVRMRESYNANSFSYQYRLINRESSAEVALFFRREQSSKNKNSMLRQFQRFGVRKIKIDDIIILPFKPLQKGNSSLKQRPFAEVHYTSIAVGSASRPPKIRSHTALISWSYQGIPRDPAERLTNWMGFRVNYYKVTDRS